MTFWDKTAYFYDWTQFYNRAVCRKLAAYTSRLIPAGAKVLDCAAGTGALSLAAAEKAKKVICTDESEKMLDIARKKAAYKKTENIVFETKDIFDLKEQDESYDTVIAGNVLHLLERPEKAVKEMYRVTKQGGRLILPTFMTGEKASFVLALYGILGFDPVHRYECREYIRMLKSCGCGKVKALRISGKIPCCFAVINKPIKGETL